MRGVLGTPAARAVRLLFAVLLVGCSSHPGSRTGEAALREFSAQGYAAERATVLSTTETWALAGGKLHVVLAQSARGDAAPVIVYLPGLGETGMAGERWRTAWAAAGYAVVSAQLLDEDMAAWRSELARAGEFRALGRERYAASEVHRRLARLAELVAEGRRRAALASTPWHRLDWTRLAVAGFDLGAYTAMAVVGEHVAGEHVASEHAAGEPMDAEHRPGAGTDTGGLGVRAAIALSPHASLAAGALDSRYRDIQAPVLCLTGNVDGDPLGLVETAALRDAPYERMPGPDKALLMLRGLSHAGLSGNAGPPGAAPGVEPTRSPAAAGAGGTGPGSHRKDGRRSGSGSGSDGATTAPERGGPTAALAGGVPGTPQMRTVAVQDVSIAFLDAYLKGDKLAREWLAHHAARWLAPLGEFRSK